MKWMDPIFIGTWLDLHNINKIQEFVMMAHYYNYCVFGLYATFCFYLKQLHGFYKITDTACWNGKKSTPLFIYSIILNQVNFILLPLSNETRLYVMKMLCKFCDFENGLKWTKECEVNEYWSELYINCDLYVNKIKHNIFQNESRHGMAKIFMYCDNYPSFFPAWSTSAAWL
jgi:hypothetical protein